MSANLACPKCKEEALHRSRSRNRIEKLMKRIIPYRLYRCHQCQWRGWISKRRANGQASYLRLSFFYLGIILLSFVIAWTLWIIVQ